MGTEASPPNLAPLGAPTSPGSHTTLSIAGSSDVNNMKIANPPVSAVPPVVVVHTTQQQTLTLQADDATLKEDKSTLQTHAYSRAGVIKLGAYSRSLIRTLQEYM